MIRAVMQNQSDKVTSIQVRADLEQLKCVREFCKEIVESIDLSNGNIDADELFCKLQLAVIETATNIIRHSYDKPESAAEFHIGYSENKSELKIEFIHSGQVFEPPKDIPTITVPLEGGMGLFLIDQCVDKIDYSTLENKQQKITYLFSL